MAHRPRCDAEDKDVTTAQFDERLQKFTAPFFMAQINTRVVRRSAAHLNYGPGKSSHRGAANGWQWHDHSPLRLLPQPTSSQTGHNCRVLADFSYTEVVATKSEDAAKKMARGNPPVEKREQMVSQTGRDASLRPSTCMLPLAVAVVD